MRWHPLCGNFGGACEFKYLVAWSLDRSNPVVRKDKVMLLSLGSFAEKTRRLDGDIGHVEDFYLMINNGLSFTAAMSRQSSLLKTACQYDVFMASRWVSEWRLGQV